MSRALTVLAAGVALAVSASSASARANAVDTAVGSQSVSQGIIMRDSGPCDAIRNMGC